jgi:hypothetical protein
MTRAFNFVSALFLFCVSLSALADGSRPAADVELRAAYCIGVKKFLIPIMDVARGGPLFMDEMKNDQFKKMQLDLERLQKFLVPRLNYVEPESVMAAFAAGSKDAETAFSELGTCSCKTQACFATCRATKPAVARTDRCVDLSWLPY